ncbi:MAG: TolC family protein [Pseudomonadota bacterium]|nr:TolC family protein [Pseudomonadota bacterium]
MALITILALLPISPARGESPALRPEETTVAPAAAPSRFTLPESVAWALQQSLVVRASKAEVKGAEARKKEAFTGFLPKLGASYAYTRLNDAPWTNMPSMTITSPILPAPLKTPGGPVVVGTQDNFSWALELRQPLFAGGAILANYRASRKGEDIARTDEETAVQNIVAEVKSAYFHILKAQKILGVARQAVEQLASHRDEAQRFFEVGLIPKNDLLQSEVQLANGQQGLVRAENGLEIAKSRFNTLLRRPIDASLEVEDILVYRPFAKALEECLQTAYQRRPEIKAHALRAEQAREAVKVAQGDFFPTVSAVGHYERFGDTGSLQGSAYKSMENWHIMARADWTFWEWGKTRHRVDAQRARENQADSMLLHERDKATLEVKAAYILVREAEKQVFVAQKSIDQAEENFRINNERYREQVATSTDVLDAQTLLTKAKSDYFTALGDYFISQVQLERAMGVSQ